MRIDSEDALREAVELEETRVFPLTQSYYRLIAVKCGDSLSQEIVFEPVLVLRDLYCLPEGNRSNRW